jgi:hypothetical protein
MARAATAAAQKEKDKKPQQPRRSPRRSKVPPTVGTKTGAQPKTDAVSFSPYKFLIVPIVQARDKDGDVCDEIVGTQVQRFGIKGLIKYANEFEKTLGNSTEAAMQALNNPPQE